MISPGYVNRIDGLLRDLGVPVGYSARAALPLMPEAVAVTSVGADVFGREQFLVPDVAGRWRELVSAAARDGIDLQLVSAFRSVDYQRDIFLRKLAAGASIDEILCVNAPPGYSEHHTGRAVDITAPGVEPLSEAFETSAAFAWLVTQAAAHRIRLSYPRDNIHGVVYEPWHWLFLEPDKAPAAVADR